MLSRLLEDPFPVLAVLTSSHCPELSMLSIAHEDLGKLLLPTWWFHTPKWIQANRFGKKIFFTVLIYGILQLEWIFDWRRRRSRSKNPCWFSWSAACQCSTAADQYPGFYDDHPGAVASYCGLRSMFATWRIGDWKDWFLLEIGVWR